MRGGSHEHRAHRIATAGRARSRTDRDRHLDVPHLEANSTIATATRLVAQVTDRALAQAPDTCAALQILGGTTTEVDAQGVTIEVVTTVPDLATCVERTTSLVRVVARDAADNGVLAESRTLLFLPGTSP